MPSIVWFTDRPARDAGQLDVEKFLTRWHEGNNSFASDPPNADLDILNGDQDANAVVELLDASGDTSSLTFDVNVLEGALPGGAFGAASLFIDGTGIEDMVCELDFYNEVRYPNDPPDDHPINVFEANSQAGGETVEESAPHGELLEPGTKYPWKWESNSSTHACYAEVDIRYSPDVTNSDVIVLQILDPPLGSNHFTVVTCDSLQCSWSILNNSVTYHVALVLCEFGTPDATCKGRAGL